MGSIRKIRQARQQISEFVSRQGKSCPPAIKNLGDSLSKQLTAVEELLHQTKAKSGQDVLNFPIRLDDKLSGVFDMANSGNMAPPTQAKEVFADLAKQVDQAVAQLQTILENGIKEFNKVVAESKLPVIVIAEK